MKMKRPAANSRAGMTMLEVLLATAILTTVVTAVSVLLRTSYAAWQAHEQDAEHIQALHATLRHLVREIRQAKAVTAISAPGELSGSLSMEVADGSTRVWAHDAATEEVRFGTGSADSLLADSITELSFAGYAADGVTATSSPDEVQLIRCTATTELPRSVGGRRSVSCWAWIRSW